jgi:hypothetical protein
MLDLCLAGILYKRFTRQLYKMIAPPVQVEDTLCDGGEESQAGQKITFCKNEPETQRENRERSFGCGQKREEES